VGLVAFLLAQAAGVAAGEGAGGGHLWGLEMGREGEARGVDEAVRWRVMGSMGLGLLALECA